jgi:hypothetical protein
MEKGYTVQGSKYTAQWCNGTTAQWSMERVTRNIELGTVERSNFKIISNS